MLQRNSAVRREHSAKKISKLVHVCWSYSKQMCELFRVISVVAVWCQLAFWQLVACRVIDECVVFRCRGLSSGMIETIGVPRRGPSLAIVSWAGAWRTERCLNSAVPTSHFSSQYAVFRTSTSSRRSSAEKEANLCCVWTRKHPFDVQRQRSQSSRSYFWSSCYMCVNLLETILENSLIFL